MPNSEQIDIRMKQIEEAKAKLPTASEAAAKAKENYYIKQEQHQIELLGYEVRMYTYFSTVINEAVQNGDNFINLKKEPASSMFILPSSGAVSSAIARFLGLALYKDGNLYSKLVSWLKENGYTVTEEKDYTGISW